LVNTDRSVDTRFQVRSGPVNRPGSDFAPDALIAGEGKSVMELAIAVSSDDFIVVVAGLLSLLRRQRGAGEFGAVDGEL